MMPIYWAFGMVPLSVALGTLFHAHLPAAIACYISQWALRALPVYISVLVVIVTFFAFLLLALFLLELRDGDLGDDSAEGQAFGTFEKLRNRPPRGCTDAVVAAVLSAAHYYEVRRGTHAWFEAISCLYMHPSISCTVGTPNPAQTSACSSSQQSGGFIVTQQQRMASRKLLDVGAGRRGGCGRGGHPQSEEIEIPRHSP
jgi:hypothetical protein